ncbi:hypothetical protein G9A89_012918 [Geosiphon pyriformis]|nr:hypothetical protein G9A89_012918 [Geosiphon pyriformis]
MTLRNLFKKRLFGWSPNSLLIPRYIPKRQLHQSLTNLNMKVIPIQVLEDNYSYLVVDKETREAAVVDPVEPEKVLSVVKSENLELKHLITTHHHWDHSGGNEKVFKAVPGIAVYGGDERIPSLTRKVRDGEEFKIGNITARALYTPCHTTGSVSFFLEDDDDKAVFTGDTLFIGGCGKFFEGSGADMHNSLNRVLGSLPPETKVYCGHEYTASNLRFAASVDPDNKVLKEKIAWVAEHKQTVPSTIGDEKKFNPFMRVDTDVIKQATGKEDPAEIMTVLRELKNKFRG